MTKFSDDITKEQIAGVIDWILEDMENHRKDARMAYEKDEKDDFHKELYTMFGLAEDMIKGRLSTICDDE